MARKRKSVCMQFEEPSLIGRSYKIKRSYYDACIYLDLVLRTVGDNGEHSYWYPQNRQKLSLEDLRGFATVVAEHEYGPGRNTSRHYYKIFTNTGKVGWVTADSLRQEIVIVENKTTLENLREESAKVFSEISGKLSEEEVAKLQKLVSGLDNVIHEQAESKHAEQRKQNQQD